MPIRRVEVIWECRLCGEEHATMRKGDKCERKGIVRPRYRMGQRVSVKRKKGGRMRGIICQVLTTFMHPFEHDVSILYKICPDTATKEQIVFTIVAEEKNMRPLGDSERSKAKRNVSNWPAFWRAFGADDKHARSQILQHLHDRGIKAKHLNVTGEPKFW